MIVGIIGTRRRNAPSDYAVLLRALSRLERMHDGITKIITGDCDCGGDYFARIYANDNNKEIDVKYKRHPTTGEKWTNDRVSGHVTYFEFCEMCYKRNEEIAKEKMDFLVAMVAPDRKGGTENTIKKFKKYEKNWQTRLIII